jgi:hypothetical protein
MIAFRQADPRYPFLWESADQPAGRWHALGEGPVHYLADTPDGAWAELLRHEEITEPADAATLRRALWAVEIGEDQGVPVGLPRAAVTGGPETWRACQRHARTRRAAGVRRLRAPSAALRAGAAHGWRVDGGERPAAPRDAMVIVIFGPAPDLTGWRCVEHGSPPPGLLPHVRHYRRPASRRR